MREWGLPVVKSFVMAFKAPFSNVFSDVYPLYWWYFLNKVLTFSERTVFITLFEDYNSLLSEFVKTNTVGYSATYLNFVCLFLIILIIILIILSSYAWHSTCHTHNWFIFPVPSSGAREQQATPSFSKSKGKGKRKGKKPKQNIRQNRVDETSTATFSDS